ncbi:MULTISPECIES: family 16 glycosylhydrolase [unclassified Mucilaginibacter]|uniref:family 16 glycosylhydrolase n=1 Tax=unclassified Mucilaginibacter TaxID=2617802 RepID=UPI002AC974D3|nr:MULTISPECIES: family 16 glycosylhydrolase [unclassified Mucilaginibacter]MEB0248726.1 family 16 glycosylhydrolase [Mucilaginibacter sp. 5B2]MEB0261988.1 family 16 glycosylhydrolase [Mucilaginibacter sp. 10I4]MEB0279748.1 family 16 glycosylhydrolase [Mucilaginibacter sp. 10B2]MEB0301629.1 family 16 glycosylhydrolase [Mucilaginibacter sp. 5C4]WPX23693.1 family 16 glycosylhydrolase [Mucilaginibacter sp. 5C4]
MRRINAFLIIALVVLFTNCSKSNDTGGSATAGMPTNLSVTPTVSTDNSGTVTFAVTADNAVSYEFDLGNGVFQTNTTGSLTYKYPVAGTYNVKVTAKSSTGKTSAKTISINVSASEALIWSDEFNTAGAPDPGKWGYDIGNNNGWGNNELEYYTNRSDNASVSNGTLKINLKKEAYNGFGYTSARLLTKGKFAFKYGRVEVRAKLPTGVGTWPAIWALGGNIDNTPWPGCGEIDIMEHVGKLQNTIFSTMHYPGHFGGGGVGSTTQNPTASTAFHVYSMDWTPTAMKFAIDGVVFYTFDNSADKPFNQDFFLILNVAFGGNFGGPAVDPNFTADAMEVDYVRVYK